MTKRILIIGGYGNFGSFISRGLAQDEDFQIIIAGRSFEKAKSLADSIEAIHKPNAIAIDITSGLENALNQIKPDIVIHTSGPFQEQGYNVAKACIAQGCHYIDLADGRDFVEGITTLDAQAKSKGILVISGASSVPCLTSALVDYYRPEFECLEALDYGITTAQKTNRGLATTAAILGYIGKPFTTIINGASETIYGWQSLHLRRYPHLGLRLLGNCDVPDISLFPKRYPMLKTVRFYAGLEIPFIHMGLWIISWLVRLGLIKNLQKTASLLLKISFLFDWLGTSNSGFHMELSGIDKNGQAKKVTFEITARSGDGPYIPCIPAILLTKKLVSGKLENAGAYPCMGFISLPEYLGALKGLDIEWKSSEKI